MIEMEEEEKVDLKEEITVYALSTCMWCRKAKKLLDDKGVEYTCFHVNEMEGEEKEKIKKIIAELNPARSYPTIQIDGEVIVGYKPDKIKEAVNNCLQKKRSMN